MLRIAETTDDIDLTRSIPDITPCETCTISTLRSNSHSSHIRKGELPLELVHSDVLGPFNAGYNGARYIVTFLCDATQLSAVYCIKAKGEVFDCFKHFKAQYERPGRTIRRLRTDNGGEYSSLEMQRYLFSNGIVPEFTVPGNPQQNGTAEKYGHILWSRAKALLKHSGLGFIYWPELVRTSNYLRMRTLHSRLPGTPYEAWYNLKPSYKHLRTPGTKCWFLQRLRNKQIDNATEALLLGYEGDHIYRLLTKSGAIIRASTVTFAAEKRQLDDTTDTPPAKRNSIHPALEFWGGEVSDNATTQDTPESPSATRTSESPSITQEPGPRIREPLPRQARTQEYHPLERALPVQFTSLKELPLEILALIGQSSPIEPFEPRTYRQAMGGRDSEKWEESMADEFNSLLENNTWELTDRPKDREVLTGRWVYKHKRGQSGEIVRYKSRYVVRGFEQREGLDYNETFASVVKPMSYKLLFALAAAYDLEIEQMDVKTAFLYGEMDVDIYLEQAEGFRSKERPDQVYKLRKALYGLKQAPRVWYNTLTDYLKTLGFTPLTADSCIFYDGKETYIAVFVDDLLIIGPSKPSINTLKAQLAQRFRMTDLGPCKYYLGMEVIRDRENRTLKLSQRGYIEKVLTDFGMWDCNTRHDTPMATYTRLQKAEGDYKAKPEDIKWYQRAVGSLMYAMLGTRPDIAYAVSVVSRFAANPDQSHKAAVTRILRYLRKTADYALVFRGTLNELAGYSDSDWAGDQSTRRSTSGFLFSIGSAVISWSSKLQPSVALSTCEAEYIGQTNATKEAIWLKRLLDEVRPELGLQAQATVIYCDNQGAIALAKNPQFHARTKHIDIQHHFVREKINEGLVQLKYIDTSDQVADGLTKALDKARFERFRRDIGLETLT